MCIFRGSSDLLVSSYCKIFTEMMQDTFNCSLHGLSILLYLLNFNIGGAKFLLESPSRHGEGKLDRAAPLLTPQVGIVYKLHIGEES